VWPFAVTGLQDFERVRRHPDIELLEALLQPLLEINKKLAVLWHVGNIDENPHQVVAITLALMGPATLNGLRFTRDSPKLLLEFQQRVSMTSSGTELPSLNRSGSRTS
jgi:hypothetical protein